MKFCAFFIILVVLLFCETRHVLTKKPSPLMEDRPHRRSHSTSECLFGKQHKEFGSTWFADLGPPFDVMYCIKCECIKVNKENRIFGHVKCRNIAKDCQELTCEDQIQVVGRCCKVCRNDTELIEVMQDATSVVVTEEEEKSNKHYAALLTNTFYSLHKDDSTNISAVNSLGQTATGRFTLHKKNLYYSFYTSSYPLPTRPKLVQFIDISGNIIEEQQVLPAGSVYQNATGKICGIWRRMPSEYRQALKEEKLNVILVWEEYDLRIRGSLMKYRPLTTEIFSSLMVSVEDSLNSDAAGTAIVSISNVTPSVHVMVVFTGLLSAKRKNDDTVQLKLFSENRQTIIAEETIVVEKPSAELNVLEYSTAVTSADLAAFAQQRVTVTLSSSKFKEPKIFGKIVPRVQCELFQGVLSPSHTNQGAAKYSQKPTRAAGVSWMFIDKNSALQYYVTLDNLAEVTVELVTARHLTVVEDLTANGQYNGTLKYLGPKSLEQLYNEELAVNIAKANGNNPSIVRGRLISRSVADCRDSPNPFLLKRTDSSVPSDMVGAVWARIDGECNLNYDVSLVGKDVDTQQYELYLEDIPFLAPGAPVTRRLLEELKGPNVEGYIFGLSQAELARLETGVVYLDVWDMKLGQSVLRTKWDKVTIPESCLPHTADNSTADNNIPSYRLFNDESEQPEATKCFHGSQFYEHGTQWTSTLDECTMCNCNRGVTKCDVILCPVLNCSQKYTVPGACCPSCYNSTQVTNSTTNACSLGGQLFAPGSAWYPYIPPNGFDTCTVCHCDASSSRVKCGRVDCPPLNCDEKLAFRPERKSCCKICPNKTKTFSYDITVSDQQDSVRNDRDILLSGGCKHAYGGPYENGKEWHPQIYFHGVERCVLCRCKDGVVRCDRKKCTKRSCEDQCCMNKSKCAKIRKNFEALRRERLPLV